MPAFIVEKDFWVCWLLGRVFATPRLGASCVFKGGTSLAKVFGAINRFSEDIDLALSPASLGWKESDLDDALLGFTASGSLRKKTGGRLRRCGETALFAGIGGSRRRVAGTTSESDGWLEL